MSTYLLQTDEKYKNMNVDSLSVLIHICVTSERYQDAWTLFQKLINKKCSTATSFTKLEMDNLFTTFRYIFGNLRWAIKALKDMDNDEIELATQEINSYIIILTNELHQLCDEFISVLINKLIPNCKTVTNFHHVCDAYKLLANCYRYKCEHCLVSNPNQLHNNIIKATELYIECINLCNKHLQISEYSYLSSYLCYAVFQHDILKEYNAAVNTLQTASDAAIDSISEQTDSDIINVLQYMRDNITIWKEDSELENENNDNDNEGIDFRKYGSTAKAKRHDPNNNHDMHELKADLSKLGLMTQNKKNPNNPMDTIRNNLYEVFIEINNDNDSINSDGFIYKDVIDLILEYEAYIDLSRFKCIQCIEYFGCDIFYNLCSECYVNKYGAGMMRQECADNLESIAIRIEWDDIVAKQRYYNMISMPSLCSIKIYFRILSRNSYRGKYLDVLDENYTKVYSIEKYNSFKKEDDEEDDEERNRKRKLNKRCITDFGIIALSAILLRY